MKVKTKITTLDAIIWNDNLSEMKHFCGDSCTITYETCSVDDYWNLNIHDDLKDRNVNVPLGYYVIKTPDDRFFILSPSEFTKYFDVDE